MKGFSSVQFSPVNSGSRWANRGSAATASASSAQVAGLHARSRTTARNAGQSSG